ncbi:conserved hypothetical protein [Culex quinquefasciatus]|uniref:Uncharacterized protein n=1 Tax=Culex quinquefasciatus TaxID=7176 RepID=B0XD71_CULQU|nr:conserved hypothetical protein [Culex quinquefasciatus]|eukprot:XP_001867593.1 conserved hypothetical protein [Culex quinquefasciatus]
MSVQRTKFGLAGIVLFTFLLYPNSLEAIEVMYESFEQINGTDTVEFRTRVRKVNRTTAALDGEIDLKKPLTNDYKIKLDFFHSPIGNQQFNYYPMKIPPSGMCDFTKNTWPNYEQYYRSAVTNTIRVGECPVEPRVANISNHLLVPQMFSDYAPTGLWKVHVVVQTEAGDGFFAIWHMKIYSDGHFG